MGYAQLREVCWVCSGFFLGMGFAKHNLVVVGISFILVVIPLALQDD